MTLVKRGAEDVCSRYRPQRLSEMVGPTAAVKALKEVFQNGESRPKAYLFYGDRGCGKTTAARIMSMGLNCESGDTPEPCLECESCKEALAHRALHITELNLAQLNTKEEADEIVRSMGLRTLTGRNRIYIFDEAQMLTKAAQNLMLKVLEEPPPRTYIFICTTDPQKLIPTLRSRCEMHEFKLPSDAELKALLKAVISQEENWDLNDADKKRFFDYAKGKAYREVLKALDMVIRGGIEALNHPDSEDGEIIEICRAITKGDWLGICDVMKRMKDAKGSLECEAIRICVLRYFAAVLKSNNKGAHSKAVGVMELFAAPFFEHEAEPRMVLSLYKACKVN